MREIELIHRQVELVAVSIGGRVQRLRDELEGLAFLSKSLFAHAAATTDTVDEWIESAGFEHLECGFFESQEHWKTSVDEGKTVDGMMFFWRGTVADDVPTRRRMYLLHTLEPHLQTLIKRLRGVPQIYYQDAGTPHASCVVPGLSLNAIPADFNWHDYHSFAIARPENNPDRAIRWSPPNVDYAGQGLICCVSIPVYGDDGTFVGVWTMDVRLTDLHADLALQSVGRVGSHQINFVTDYQGKVIAHPVLDPAKHAEKGSVHDVTLSKLDGDFATLNVAHLAAQEHGQLELNDVNGQRLVVAFRTIPEIGWIIFAAFPAADMIEATQAAFKRAFDKLRGGDLSFRLDAVGDETMRQLVTSYNEMTHALQESLQRREEAEAAKRKIALEGERLARELEIAATIQISMLPRKPRHPGFEFAGHMKPANEVGGDFYDILSANDRLWMTIGDVSSHGLGAGLVMMIAQAVVQSVFESNPALPADEVLRLVNRLLHANMSRGLGRGHYLTAQLFLYRGAGVFDCVGGHLWPLIFNRDENTITTIDIPGPWLGIIPNLPRVPVTRLHLKPGEIMCLYSDGITEARNANGDWYGLERLRDTLQALLQSSRTLDECSQDLLRDVEMFSAEQDDDRSILLVRYVGD